MGLGMHFVDVIWITGPCKTVDTSFRGAEPVPAPFAVTQSGPTQTLTRPDQSRAARSASTGGRRSGPAGSAR